MRILVTGLLPYDSGKTTFSLSLIRSLSENNIKFFPHKPVAGHNAWYSYSTLIRSGELHILLGNDALKYYDETGFNPAEINPFDVLLSPVDLQKLSFDIRFYKQLMSEGLPVMVRTYDCTSPQSEHFILHDLDKLVPDTLSDKLKTLGSELKASKTDLQNMRELIDLSPQISEKCTNKILSEYENVIIESYNDALAPNLASLEVDFLFAISPGKAFLIEDFKEIIRLFSYPPWLINVSSFIKYSRKIRSFRIETYSYKLSDELLDFLLQYL
ncbi:MAG: hypothetical protein RXR59_06170 [Sulfolobus sp.]|jgi:predicted P-loop ATPase/GTPase|nr:hypothetical protein [Sulfolobaceae archaeon]